MLEIFACSGPGAGAVIAESIQIGYFHACVAGALFFIALLLTAVRFRCRSVWVAPILLGFLLALHPAWTVSAGRGDCGERLRAVAFNTSVVCVVVLAIQMLVVLRQLFLKVAGRHNLQHATEG